MSTYQEIIDAAHGKSLKNQPGLIATQATELLNMAWRSLMGLYSFGVRINPGYFGKIDTISFGAPGWAVPADLEILLRVEDAGGDEVLLVPFDDPTIADPEPALFHWGKVLRNAGNTNDPTAGDLDFFYAHSPVVPAAIGDPLDPTWDSDYDELLVLELAIYLALKDSRFDEVVMLQADRDRWALLYAAHLEHYLANETDRFAARRPTNTDALVPIGSLLAGGSTIELAA